MGILSKTCFEASQAVFWGTFWLLRAKTCQKVVWCAVDAWGHAQKEKN